MDDSLLSAADVSVDDLPAPPGRSRPGSVIDDQAPADAAGASTAAAAAAASSSSADASAAAPAHASGSVPEKTGWMSKNSYNQPSVFNSYYFVLVDNALQYFVAEDSPNPKGVIQLEGCSCEIVPESKYGFAACFELNSPLQSRLFALACDNQEVMQQWINTIRTCMLKIRRAKAKQAAALKRAAVEGAAAESQQAQQAYREQQQAMANAALAQQSASANAAHPPANPYAQPYPDPLAPSPASASSAAHSADPAVMPNANGAYNSASAGGGMPHSSDDKYSIYRQWLDETKGARKSSMSTNLPGAGGRGSMSGDLHHNLLDEDQKKGGCESWCGCLPAWCFR